MTARIREDFPEFIKLIPPTEKSEGLYRRIRHIQAKGECCGVPMTKDQLRQIMALAGHKSVKNPLNYLCVVIGRARVEKTLLGLKKARKEHAPLDVRIKQMAKYIHFESAWQVRVLSGWISGKYSMDDLMTACEIAQNKENPVRYLLAMFRHGYKKPREFAKA